jgi:hypothetical protein
MQGIFVESLGYSLMIGYNTHHAYPFSTYGELVFLLMQNVLILNSFLVFHDKKVFGEYVGYVGILAAVIYMFFNRIVPLWFF